MRPVFFATAILALIGCASAERVGSSTSALSAGEMIIYEPGRAVPASELVDLGPPEGLGGTVLSGDPHISARVDHAENGLLAGVFQATQGTVLIRFPFTEHATILEGEVALTDEVGNHHLFKPGDSYLIRQGSDILWDVKGARVQKSFFNRTDASDAPGPMIVYKKGTVADDADLVDLGPPSELGGTVLSGDPRISARIDSASDGLAGGIFQATRGDVSVLFPFTEHATVLRGEVILTDETGLTKHLLPGDSYLIKQGSDIFWSVTGPRVQKSFFNVMQP
jgi:uncharacterized protein